ncbi:hypothetical protein RPD_1146 [Rhodopseudomonas palustris BisB5]|uniref:Uncharacterized protein n=1 Tax=Rhodopseudomonas palustris (strain BisB5) TaxID=316057 RepID=Q13C05_RHOPS|nr:hypothetical protein RPD_1146 [Rhodopseudomonas palustris BisB5]
MLRFPGNDEKRGASAHQLADLLGAARRRVLGGDQRGEGPALQAVEILVRGVEAEIASVANDDARGARADFNHVGVGHFQSLAQPALPEFGRPLLGTRTLQTVEQGLDGAQTRLTGKSS